MQHPNGRSAGAQVNRLLYRSKQRGFLEMDLLVGLWAERNLPTMDKGQLAAMETVLDQENPDLFKWLTGQEEAPEAMKANPAFTVSTQCSISAYLKVHGRSLKTCVKSYHEAVLPAEHGQTHGLCVSWLDRS